MGHKDKKRKKDKKDKKDKPPKDSRDTGYDWKKHARDVTKATETLDEKRARRLAKKEYARCGTVLRAPCSVLRGWAHSHLPHRSKAQRKESKKELFGYSNENNPFNDDNLFEPFKWGKKIDQDKDTGKWHPGMESQEYKRARLKDVAREIQKVKVDRENYELEQQMWEEERSRMTREKEALQMLQWDERAREGDYQQLLMKARQRIAGGRAQPIDMLTRNISYLDADEKQRKEMDVETREPYKIVHGLASKDLESLAADIQKFVDYGKHRDYWESLAIVVSDALQVASRVKARDMNAAVPAPALHEHVEHEVSLDLERKSIEELDRTMVDVQKKISKGGGGGLCANTTAASMSPNPAVGKGVDVDYWSGILDQVRVARAKVKLRGFHQDLLDKHLSRLEKAHRSKMEGVIPQRDKAGLKSGQDDSIAQNSAPIDDWDVEPPLLVDFDEAQCQDALDVYLTLVKARATVVGNKSSTLYSEMRAALAKAGADDEDEDMKALTGAEVSVPLYACSLLHHIPSPNSCLPRARISPWSSRHNFPQLMIFDLCLYLFPCVTLYLLQSLSLRKYSAWMDKYRPKKPKYFNRVHTGYDWNKYNITHYDYDNPPPKVVIGYKFNIFYPDLVDPINQQPAYFVDATDKGWNDDTCILRFSAGPPYEDIAFRIVNKEWDVNLKSTARAPGGGSAASEYTQGYGWLAVPESVISPRAAACGPGGSLHLQAQGTKDALHTTLHRSPGKALGSTCDPSVYALGLGPWLFLQAQDQKFTFTDF
eukprot:gene12283-2241_t